MSEDKNENPMTKEIIELAQRINRFAVRKGWSKGRLIREYTSLGSERTFRDMLAGRGDAYDLSRQLLNLQQVWGAIEEVSGEGCDEVIYDDISNIPAIGAACLNAMKNWGINRIVIVLAEPGCGKTTAMRRLAAKYTDRVIICEATDVWADKPSALLGAMLKQLGEATPPVSAVEKLDLLQQKLGVTRRCMVIDEAHHLGPRCLNTIKTLINTTPGEFVLMAIPSLWAKLAKGAYIEAKQLSTNRLSELVQIEIDERDISTYIRHRVPGIDRKLSIDAAKLMHSSSIANGNMSFVRDVVDEIEAEPNLTTKVIAEAIASTLAKRTQSGIRIR